MERVTDIGSIFFRAQNPKQLQEWYRAHLGIEPSADGMPVFFWREREISEAMEFGRFAWGADPEGNRFESSESAPGS